MARRLGGRVVLLTTEWEDEWTTRDSRIYLDELAQRSFDVPMDVELVNAHPAAAAIVKAADQLPDSIVCMTSHGRGALRWAAFGSVAENVLHRINRPVVLVGRHCEFDDSSPLEHMLVCVGGANVAEPIVPVAAAWAKSLGLDVRIALVLHPLDADTGIIEEDVLAAIAREFEQFGVQATPMILRGSFVAGAIVDEAQRLPAAMIGMNTHARSAVGRLTVGSVSMATVGLAPCPVLVAPFPHI